MSGRDHENLYVCVYICVGFFFIITLVDLHNTHVLNYTINNKKKLHTKHQKTFSSLFSKLLLNTEKLDSFLENTF